MLDTPPTPNELADSLGSMPPAVPPEIPAQPFGCTPAEPAPLAAVRRIPHFGHVALLSLLLLAGLVCSVILILVAVHFHLFGVFRLEDTMRSMPYAVGTMLAWYLIAFAPAAAVFPVLWKKNFPAGLQWNLATPRRIWPILMGTGVACFLVALTSKSLLHFPDKSPIAGLISTPAAAWTFFAFAVTIAPLCEEVIFRGFLLPAFSTAFDWTGEKLTRRPVRPLLESGHPHWSVPAMVLASIFTSALFAAFHVGQIGNAPGPVVLIFCVSLVLCAVRLATRSLAASTLTHATYNFSLFFLMMITTRGFHNLHI